MPNRSIEQPRTTQAAKPQQDLSRRTMHGGTAWTAITTEDNAPLYQPQDSPSGERKAVAGESEDARLTGGTRSLMRRLSGLNLTPSRRRVMVPRPTVGVA